MIADINPPGVITPNMIRMVAAARKIGDKWQIIRELEGT
ncbi:hypothetical protein CEXT_537401, partial [Caerostris extrusa]